MPDAGIIISTRIHLMNDFGMAKTGNICVYFMYISLGLSFPGVQKPLDDYGPSSTSVGRAAPAKDAGDDDDDFDLFGSEDEEEVHLSD